MEKEIVPVGEKLKYMLGLRFDRTERGGFYVFFGFYWFCFCLFRKWPLPFFDGLVTGLSLAYGPNPTAGYGDLMWKKDKQYLRFDHSGDFRHATKI